MTDEKPCPLTVMTMPSPAAVEAFDAMTIDEIAAWAESNPRETAVFLRALAENGADTRAMRGLSAPDTLGSLWQSKAAVKDVFRTLSALGDEALALTMAAGVSCGDSASTFAAVLARRAPEETTDLLMNVKRDDLRFAIIHDSGKMAESLLASLPDIYIRGLLSSFQDEEWRAQFLMLPAVFNSMKECDFIEAISGLQQVALRGAVLCAPEYAAKLALAGLGLAALESVREAPADLRAEVLASPGFIPGMQQIETYEAMGGVVHEITRLKLEAHRVKVLSAPGVAESLAIAGYMPYLENTIDSFRDPLSAPTVFATAGVARVFGQETLSRFAQQFAFAVVMEKREEEAPRTPRPEAARPKR